MTLTVEFVSKTQHYLKVKKPILERQRRARINKHLDALKVLLAEFKGDNNILRLDKAEMLESALVFLKNDPARMPVLKGMPTATPLTHMDGFRNGYMNAVNEVSRVMASTPGMSVDIGKAVMVHLGREFNRILNYQLSANKLLAVTRQRSVSPASSGYHSDSEPSLNSSSLWRPW